LKFCKDKDVRVPTGRRPLLFSEFEYFASWLLVEEDIKSGKKNYLSTVFGDLMRPDKAKISGSNLEWKYKDLRRRFTAALPAGSKQARCFKLVELEHPVRLLMTQLGCRPTCLQNMTFKDVVNLMVWLWPFVSTRSRVR
jgi:hypothetical protein